MSDLTTIYKYQLELTDLSVIYVPVGATFLDVQIQHGTLCLWAIVDPGNATELVEVRVRGTGHPMGNAQAEDYAGTVQLADQGLVFHVFLTWA